MQSGNPWRRGIALAAALVLLNISLTFRNIWPTPAIRWHGELSVELAVCVLVLALASRWFGAPSRAALRWLGVLWVLLVIGHYADVTAPALYGREINLFWDVRYVSAVAAMLARAAPLWLVLLTCAAAVLIPILLYGPLRWALGRVGAAMANFRERRALGLLAAAAIAFFIGQRLSDRFPAEPKFSNPVTQTYAGQARLLVAALASDAGSRSPGPSPSMNSDLSLVKGADVLLMFIESYGAVSYERPEFAQGLAASRGQFQAAIHATNRDAVSAYVESPTFGGSSWLAHISLMSGIDVRDQETNALLMTQKRDTLATAFARHGYRTVALMPGMRQSWPEGAFYEFDHIYTFHNLGYRGPEFGWWNIPDQFTIAQVDALEMRRPSRAPLLVFFPTITTHLPFSPTAPYQPDWPRVLTDQPYDAADLEHAFAEEPDWVNFGPSYVNALAYTYTWLGGYLRQRADRDFVMILIGDHQPPAMVSGEGVPWDVPVHVIASRRQVLERLLTRGFRAGLTPDRPAVGRMHALMPMLLDSFGDRESSTR